MNRLIFFSGGVESTALLTLADSYDIVVVVEPPLGITTTYKPESIDSILDYYKLKKHSAVIQLPYLEGIPQDALKQWKHFMNIADMMCAVYPSVSEVWSGRCLEDNPEREYQPAWPLLQPEVPWNKPLKHLTKKEQWDLLPTEVQQEVSTCIWHRDCGECFKCKEFKELVLDKPSPLGVE